MDNVISEHAAQSAAEMVQENPIHERLLIQYDIRASNFGYVILNKMSELSAEEIKLIQNLSSTPSVAQSIFEDDEKAEESNDTQTNVYLPNQFRTESVVKDIDNLVEQSEALDRTQVYTDAPLTHTEKPNTKAGNLETVPDNLKTGAGHPETSKPATRGDVAVSPPATIPEAPVLDTSRAHDPIRKLRLGIQSVLNTRGPPDNNPRWTDDNVSVDEELERLLGPPDTHATDSSDGEDESELDRHLGVPVLEDNPTEPRVSEQRIPTPEYDMDISQFAKNNAKRMEEEVVKGVQQRQQLDANIKETIQHIHDFQQRHSPRPTTPSSQAGRRLPLSGGNLRRMELLSAYLEGLRALWALFTRGHLDTFRSKTYDTETGMFLYPSLATLIAQASTVDHDLLQPQRDSPIGPLNNQSDFMERKKLLTSSQHMRNDHIHRCSLNDDFNAVVLPAVKLYLRQKDNLVNTAFRWVNTKRNDRVQFMLGLLKKAEIHDLRVRFVVDKQMFNRPLAQKHVNDYYRVVLEQRLLDFQLGDPLYRGMAVDSFVSRSRFDVPTVMALLTDLDPESDRMGFLLPEACSLLSKSRNRATIQRLVEMARERLQIPIIRTLGVVYKSRIAQRRLYLLKRLGPQMIQALAGMPSGIIQNIGV